MLADQHRAIRRSEATSAQEFDVLLAKTLRQPSFRSLQAVGHVLSHDLSKNLARLDVLQTDVGPHCCLDAAMPQQPPNQFVLAGTVLQNERTGGMPELVDGHPQPGCIVNSLGNLHAERGHSLGAPALTREQPVLVTAPQQAGTEVVDVFLDKVGEIALEGVL